MIYLFVFILLLIPVVKYDLMAKTGGERGWFCFNLVVLILLAGLRYRVGGDTLMYMSIYDDLPSLADLKYFDFAEADFNPLWYIREIPRMAREKENRLKISHYFIKCKE